MSINRARSETAGIVNLLLGAAPPTWSPGVERGGGETRRRNEEDGFVGEGRRKGDLKRRTLIGGDEAAGVLAVTFAARYLFAFK